MTPSILAVADSDSYLKLAAHLLHQLGDGWRRRVVVVRTPTSPTDEQIRAAFSGTDLDPQHVQILPLSHLTAGTVTEDVLFASATGPIVSEIYARILRSETVDARRTALVSALPGVAFPATAKGWNYRRAGDAFICHSHAEVRDFSFLADSEPGHQPTLLLGKLPFLTSPGFPATCSQPINRVVFAAQAKVPSARDEREQILLALEGTARMNPGTEVIIKLRARAGEPQTHLEQYPYDALLEQMVQDGRLSRTSHIRFATGALHEFLVPGTALATVSSTAALEALDHGLPTLVINDFGVDVSLINTVFVGSGIQGSLQQLQMLGLSNPNRAWLRENYFHRNARDLHDALQLLASRAQTGTLQTDEQMLSRLKNFPLRQRVRTVMPRPMLEIARKLRRILGQA
ncbi:hypothetical protein GcLGCM259_2960 [Glutamicibacter creatinolyticus]|uniref:Uncharacterized protein n=1 Tax=Glutamicibacter creatinolyticus TaxID=162496 RepID=A0A5B7WX74_9MICC|nr:DUF6716 putative glycosyltransferase [Glutamicibacter creatinolyticus]QCY48666.1 hypothetical protein GcLGCM259_2960 [Glutamicibacter creatinolyticus]